MANGWGQQFDQDPDFKALFFGEDKALYFSKNKLKSFISDLLIAERKRILEMAKQGFYEPDDIALMKQMHTEIDPNQALQEFVNRLENEEAESNGNT